MNAQDCFLEFLPAREKSEIGCKSSILKQHPMLKLAGLAGKNNVPAAHLLSSAFNGEWNSNFVKNIRKLCCNLPLHGYLWEKPVENE